MSSLFGVPMNILMAVFIVAVAAVTAVVLVLALRNPILVKLGLRNLPRRRGRTVLIVLGLMLGTVIIAAALSTGDTMTHTIRSSVLTSLGHIDEVISTRGSQTGDNALLDTGSPVDVQYFEEELFTEVRDSLGNFEFVDGLAPAIVETVSVRSEITRRNEPRMTVFAIDPRYAAGFGDIEEMDGRTVFLDDLEPGEVYLNREAQEELNVRVGDELIAFVGEDVALTVKAIVEYEGVLTDSSAMLMPLAAAQELLGRPELIKHILVSNEGGPLSGAQHTDIVMAAFDEVLASLDLEAEPTKQDALDFAEELGNVFTQFFVTFGTFSIVAGIMLIFLIFVMLATERKSEMGMARAVGTKRNHLVQMFLYEGAVYDLVAAGVGALLGLAISYGMVFVMAKAFATFGVDIRHDFQPRSLIIAYTLGMLLTFAVVTVSAWRVSVLNIVTAIRALPDNPKRGGGRWTWALGFLAFALGAALGYAGYDGKQATPFMLGVSFGIVGLVPLLRGVRLPDRIAYTIPGIGLMVWWLLPFTVYDRIIPDASRDITIFIISGLMVVIGATWVVMYNSDGLLNLIMLVFGRMRRLAPVLKTAVSYPLTNRFRTGMTVAMFSLIVFTLVVMATLTNAFSGLFNDEEAFGGGFDIRATAARITPIEDIEVAIDESEELNAADIEVVASQSVLSLEARQIGGGNDFESYLVRGLDEEFLTNNTYELALIAEGYDSAQEVWHAVADEPGLAIIDPIPVPRRDDFGFAAGLPDFQLEGFFIEDGTFEPVRVEVRDPRSGDRATLTIVGVLKDTFPNFMLGIGASQETLEDNFPEQAIPTIHFFELAEEVDREAMADSLESEFLANGLEAGILADELQDAVATQLTFNYILQGFMGLGLLVGIAALGVISARSVVERRQEIGVLRAIGFRRSMVQLSFLLESSFVALLGIAVGCVLGLILSYNIVEDTARDPNTAGITFAVPWLNLAIIFAIAYGAALVTTFLPARQAAAVYPAEALRYE